MKGDVVQNGGLVAVEGRHAETAIWEVQRGLKPLGIIFKRERSENAYFEAVAGSGSGYTRTTNLADAMRWLGEQAPEGAEEAQ